MRRFQFFLVFTIINVLCVAQTKEDQAKKLYFAAEDAYNNENYSVCIEKLKSVEDLLGSTNSKVLELKIKAYYSNLEFVDAFIAKSDFLKITTNSYPGYDNILRISDEIDEKAIPLFEKEGKIAFERKNYKKAKFCLEKSYLNEPGNKEIAYLYLQSVVLLNEDSKSVNEAKQKINELDEKAKQEEFSAYKLAIENESLEYCEKYLANYPNGKYKDEVLRRKQEIVSITDYENDLRVAVESKNFYASIYFKEKYKNKYNKEDLDKINTIIEEEKSKVSVAWFFIGDVFKGYHPTKGKWGIVNSNGQEITSCKYDEIGDFSEGIAWFGRNVQEGYVRGYINYKGEEIFYVKNISVSNFSDGLAKVSIDNKYVYINYAGEKVFEFQYVDMGNFSEGMAWVQYKKYGYINIYGEEITDIKYDDVANTFNEGMAFVKRDGKYGFINNKGEEVVERKYDFVANFSDDLALVKKDGKCGYINKQGKEIIEKKFDECRSFSEGMAYAKKGLYWGYINKQGEEVTDFKYDCSFYSRTFFSEGLGLVKKDWKYGFVNENGKEVIEPKYDDAGNFSEEMAWVKKGKKYGYINKQGEVIVDFKYNYAGSFKNGIAPVRIKKKWALINKEGKEITDFKYDYIVF